MKKYTVVGLITSDDPPCRVAWWVNAGDPDQAVEVALKQNELDAWQFLLAGVFDGHLYARDEQ